jgi:hypothetical protein
MERGIKPLLRLMPLAVDGFADAQFISICRNNP